ncbi:MAG: hypothetical protein IJS02_03445 [Bacteroidales bacterium]|nr:hypothetical protein [Bacteroidales bacterium]
MKKLLFLLVALVLVTPSCTKSSFTQIYNVGFIPGVSAYHFESEESMAKVEAYFKQLGFTSSSVVFTGVNVYDCDQQASDYFKALVKNVTDADIKAACNLADDDFFEWLMVVISDHVFVIEEYDYNVFI